jgi:hypothetical protein
MPEFAAETPGSRLDATTMPAATTASWIRLSSKGMAHAAIDAPKLTIPVIATPSE